MDTPRVTLEDFPAELRDSIAALTAGFLPTIDSADEITPERFEAWFRVENKRIYEMATDFRHPTREAMLARLSGTYDVIREREGLAEGELLHMRL